MATCIPLTLAGSPKVLLCNTVFRIAIYASENLKAGTELFFFYNYPEHMTKHFKQPTNAETGKLFAAKHPAKQLKKPKRRTASFRSPEYRPFEISAAREEALALARAARAAKRDTNGQSARNESRPGLKQARKSAPNGPSRSLAYQSNNSNNREETDEEVEDSPWAANDSEPHLEIQDTDEDDNFVPDHSQEVPIDPDEFAGDEENDSDLARAQLTGGMAPRTGKGRPRAVKSAATSVPQLAAVKMKKKKGGVRPGAGRKRKRPVISNSDDEL